MVQEVRDLPDGYALQLPNNTETFLHAAQYIAHERKCCSFFHFVLELEPEGGPIWLHLRGKDGVKAFLQAELGQVLSENLMPMPS